MGKRPATHSLGSHAPQHGGLHINALEWRHVVEHAEPRILKGLRQGVTPCERHRHRDERCHQPVHGRVQPRGLTCVQLNVCRVVEVCMWRGATNSDVLRCASGLQGRHAHSNLWPWTAAERYSGRSNGTATGLAFGSSSASPSPSCASCTLCCCCRSCCSSAAGCAAASGGDPSSAAAAAAGVRLPPASAFASPSSSLVRFNARPLCLGARCGRATKSCSAAIV